MQTNPPESNQRIQLGAIPAFITRIAPFLLPALFFQSAIFAFISPLPLFILTLRNQLWLSVVALITNACLLYSMGTRTEFNVSVFLWMMIGVFFPFLIRKYGRIKKSFALSFLVFVSVMVGFLFYFSHQANLNPAEYLRTEISLGVDHMAAIPDSPIKKLIEEDGRENILKELMTELPSGILISIILAFWINLLFASQLMGGFLSKAFWSTYRNPEWLIWPTLGFAALFAFTDHAPYFVGLNGFKVLLVFYGFQGLSVLSFILNRFKVLGFGRAVLFAFSIFLAMPIVLSLGFFDLWFDFRRKFGQS
jgi:hypothetical protein